MIKNRGLAKMLKPLLVMVAGAQKVCKWKADYQTIRVSSARVISWISQKNEFSRGAMEKTLGLTLAQAEWHIKELVRNGRIKRTSMKAPKIPGISKQQVIYKFIN